MLNTPCYVNLIRSEPLCASTFNQRSLIAHTVAEESRLCDHDPIVDAEPLVCRENLTTALSCHDAHHILKPLVTSNTPDDEYLFTPDMRHRPLRDFDKHCKHRLLQREA